MAVICSVAMGVGLVFRLGGSAFANVFAISSGYAAALVDFHWPESDFPVMTSCAPLGWLQHSLERGDRRGCRSMEYSSVVYFWCDEPSIHCANVTLSEGCDFERLVRSGMSHIGPCLASVAS